MTSNLENSIKIILNSYKENRLTENDAMTLMESLFETKENEVPYKIYTSPFPYDDTIKYTTHTYNNINED